MRTRSRIAGVSKPVIRYVLILAVLALAVSHYTVWPPDTMLMLTLLVCAGLGQFRAFTRHLVPFIVLFALYSVASSVADDINPNVHYLPMAHFDEWLGGGRLPTSHLQDLLWNGHVRWYDYYFYVLYTAHFVAPVVLALFLWKRRGQLYWSYLASLGLLSLSAFLTYVLFPAAPPWMSSSYGYIEPIHRVSYDIWTAVGIDSPDTLYSKLSPNLVAAVPSLHSAFPLLIFLFLVRSFGLRRVWWAALYPVSMWVGVVYLGEHYVFDVLCAIAYTAAAATIGTALARRFTPRLPSPDGTTPKAPSAAPPKVAEVPTLTRTSPAEAPQD
ncbi:phosphatase PAP2 family protein [Actinocorallia sp. A-T 12471]|uniref:phosphatase PAP2 family protein n=1 Tax=Actinocorallia sp. A-T 12471 TaxID=3089813 RepID=UPI0029CB0F10|nr:phosphatase PAP2 family protein [Actinocorallia sp. A-T 12471]MDX6742851.1 phosphatase PAP2 family protein [Actinocorallia sp. A-T 12471]